MRVPKDFSHTNDVLLINTNRINTNEYTILMQNHIHNSDQIVQLVRANVTFEMIAVYVAVE